MTRIEVKTFDHTANMGLAFASLISCGLDGIKRNLKLPAPVIGNPEDLGEASIKER